jgi:MFS family permease
MAGHFCLQVTWALFLILSVYIKTLGGSDAQVGAIMGGAGISAVIAIPAVAFLVDRYGRRPFMLFGGICAALGSLVFVLLDYLSVWFFVARIVQGVGFSLYLNAALTLLADLLPPERRAKGVGIFGLSGNVAIAVGPPIAETLVEATGGAYRVVFILASLLSIGGLVAAYAVVEPPKPPRSLALRPWGAAEAWGLREPTLLGLVQGAGFGVLMTFVPAYAQTEGVIFTPFFFAYTVTVVLARVLGGRLVDMPDRQRLLTPFLMLGVVGTLVVALGAGLVPFVLAGVVFGFAHGVLYPVLSALALEGVRPEHRGKSIGLFSLGFSIGANLLIIPYGVAADVLGYRWMFMMAALTLAAGAFYAYEYGRRHPAAAGAVEAEKSG